jgi:hypothetical protein
MPCAKVTSVSLCAASFLGEVGEADDAAEVAVDEACVSVVVFEQALKTRAAAATAASPYPYRLCCIAHPSSIGLDIVQLAGKSLAAASTIFGSLNMGQLVFR